MFWLKLSYFVAWLLLEMAFRPYVEFQSSVDVVEDELLKALQKNIQKALSEAPLIPIGEKRSRIEQSDDIQQKKPSPPRSPKETNKYKIYKYKYQIEHLSDELDNANEQIRYFKQVIQVGTKEILHLRETPLY